MEPAEHEPWARGYGRLPERNARQLALRLPPDWLLAPQDGLESETRRIVMADIAEQRSPRMREVGNGATEARGIMVSSQRDPAHGFALTLATVAPGSSALATGAASQRGSPRNPDATRYPTAVLSSDLSPRNMGPSQWIGGSLQRTGVEFLGGDIAVIPPGEDMDKPRVPMSYPGTDGVPHNHYCTFKHGVWAPSFRPEDLRGLNSHLNSITPMV